MLRAGQLRLMAGQASLRRKALAMGIPIALVVALALSASTYVASLAITVAIASIGATSLAVLMGWAGQPSLLVAPISLLGGYCAAAVGGSGSMSLLLGVLAGISAGGVLGLFSSLVARRLTGMYLVMATLAILFIVSAVGNDVQSAASAPGGFSIASPSLFGAAISTNRAWVWIAGAAAALVYIFYSRLSGTRLARGWRLIREDRNAAAVAGISVGRYLTAAFVLTSAITGLAGALQAYYLGNVSYSAYGLVVAVDFVVMVVLGGNGPLGGAVFGALVVTQLPTLVERIAGSGRCVGAFARDLPYLESCVFAVVGILVLVATSKAKGSVGLRFKQFIQSLEPRMIVSKESSVTTNRKPLQAEPRVVETSHSMAASSTQIDTELSSEEGSTRRPLPAPGNGGIGGPKTERSSAIEVHGLRVRYGHGEDALRDVTLVVEQGKTFGIIGRNGAGKTTLLGAVAGFPIGSGGQVVEGNVVIANGDRKKTLNGASIARRFKAGVILVPAEDKVFPNLTVEEHLRQAARPGGEGTADVERALDFFPALRGRMQSKAGHLSGGERQLLAFACVTTRAASVLLIDEASLGLSPVATAMVASVLRELQERQGGTAIIVDQNPYLVASVADVIALMEAGEIVDGDVPLKSADEVASELYLGAGRYAETRKEEVGAGGVGDGD